MTETTCILCERPVDTDSDYTAIIFDETSPKPERERNRYGGEQGPIINADQLLYYRVHVTCSIDKDVWVDDHCPDCGLAGRRLWRQPPSRVVEGVVIPAKPQRPYYPRPCEPCRLIESARRHERAATEMRRKAAELLRKRSARGPR